MISYQKTNSADIKNMLRNRFGNHFNWIDQNMPDDIILSFFYYSYDSLNTRFTILKHFTWIDRYAYFYIISIDNKLIGLFSISFGSSMLAMLLEELTVFGVLNILLVGTACSLSSDVRPFDFILPDCALMYDGVSPFYSENSNISYPNRRFYKSLEAKFQNLPFDYHLGASLTTVHPYFFQFAFLDDFDFDVICVDMELALFFAASDRFYFSSAAIFLVSDFRSFQRWDFFFKSKLMKKRKWQILQIAFYSF